MAKEAGKKSFLDFFKMKDLDDDEFDDDLFDDDDDDDDDDYVPAKPPKKSQSTASRRTSAEKPQPVSRQNSYSGQARLQRTRGRHRQRLITVQKLQDLHQAVVNSLNLTAADNSRKVIEVEVKCM